MTYPEILRESAVRDWLRADPFARTSRVLGEHGWAPTAIFGTTLLGDLDIQLLGKRYYWTAEVESQYVMGNGFTYDPWAWEVLVCWEMGRYPDLRNRPRATQWPELSDARSRLEVIATFRRVEHTSKRAFREAFAAFLVVAMTVPDGSEGLFVLRDWVRKTFPKPVRR